MAEVIEATGKTVDEALNNAVAKLGVTIGDVTYEIIEQPSSGFFGIFGAKPAKIRVTLEPKRIVPSATVTDIDRKSMVMDKAVNEVQYSSSSTAVATDTKSSNTIIDAGDVAQYVAVDSDNDSDDGKSDTADEPIKLTEINPEIYTLAENFLKDIFRIMKLEVELERKDTPDSTIYSIKGNSLGILIGKHGQTLESLQYLTNLVANKNPVNGYQRIILDVEDYRTRREETLRRLANRLADKVCRIHREVHLEPMSRHERKIIHMTLQGNKRVTTYSAGENPRRFVVIAPKRRGDKQEKDRHEEQDRDNN